MKLVVLIALLLAMAQPADACGVPVLGVPSDSEPLPPPEEPEPSNVGLKVFGALLVSSVVARWIIADAARRAA